MLAAAVENRTGFHIPSRRQHDQVVRRDRRDASPLTRLATPHPPGGRGRMVESAVAGNGGHLKRLRDRPASGLRRTSDGAAKRSFFKLGEEPGLLRLQRRELSP